MIQSIILAKYEATALEMADEEAHEQGQGLKR